VDVHLSAFSFFVSFFLDGGPGHDVQGAGKKYAHQQDGGRS